MTLIKLPKSAHMDRMIFGRSPALQAVKDMRKASRQAERIMKGILKSGKMVKVKKKGKTRGRPSKWEREATLALNKYLLDSQVMECIRKAHEDALIFGVGYCTVPLRPDFDGSAKTAMDKHLAPRRHRIMTATEILERQKKILPIRDKKFANQMRKIDKEVMKPMVKATMKLMRKHRLL